MEVENVASKGVANTALGLGIAGLSVGVLDAMGGLSGILGNRATTDDGDKAITRHEMELYSKIATLESQKYTDAAFAGVNAQLAQQATWNAVAMSNISVLQNQTNLLMGMTKLGIPSANIITPPSVDPATTSSANG